MDYSVTKNGKPLDKDLYEFDEETKVFTTSEDYLVLDFSCVYGVTFTTGPGSTFTSGSNCTFNTGSNCTFNTSHDCTFNTGHYCVFNTGSYCTFNTSHYCVFNTGSYCIFNTSYDCIFNTNNECTFNTGNRCTFNNIIDRGFKTVMNCTYTLADTLVVIVKNTESTKVYNINDYYHKNLKGFEITCEELDKLKLFPLDEPRLLMLHKYDDLGKRLFEHYQKKGLL